MDSVNKRSLHKEDEIVFEYLARRVRILSAKMVGVLLGEALGDPEGAGKAWMERFSDSKLVDVFTVLARPPASAEVLLAYYRGAGAPDFAALARELKTRAEAQAPENIQVVRLGKAGEKLFGVQQPRRPRRGEASHDLQLAAMAVSFRMEHVTSWLSEDELARIRAYDGVVPDAEVYLADGGAFVVECGGSYSKGKLQAFHAALAPQLERRGMGGYFIV